MSAILGTHKECIKTWTLEELVGGLPGRESGAIHEALLADIEKALEVGDHFAGAKHDVQKSFDTINPGMELGWPRYFNYRRV